MSSDRILVTGAGGFIGRHIVSRARLRGCCVIGTHHRPASADEMKLDVCDSASVCAALSEFPASVVIHCASYGVNYSDQDVDRAIEVNIHGTLRVLSAAAQCGCRLFIHLGSCSEYGSQDGFIREDAPLKPSAIYGATKAATTLLILERARALGIALLVVRLFGTWGPGEGRHRLVPQVLEACTQQRALDLTSCDVLRDYMYVEDTADRIVSLALNPDIPVGVLNIASGRAVVLREFVCTIARILGGESLMCFGKLSPRPTEMKSLLADVGRMRQIIGAGPITPLNEGLRRMTFRMN